MTTTRENPGEDPLPSFHLVDAFTTTAFRGNPAGVVVLEDGPVDADLAQRVAAEVGAARTVRGHDRAAVRTRR